MVTSNQPLIYASAVTEDDGYVYPDDASEEEKDEIDEQEQEAWEDAGRPGDDDDDSDDNDDDDGDDDGDDGDPNPYCDTERGKAAQVCHDRLDYDQETGLYPCNDGTSKVDWKDCKDATKKNSDNDNDGPDNAVVPASQNCDTWSYDLDIKLAAVNAKTELLNSQYDDAQTDEEIDKYNAQVDKVGAEVDVVNAELDRFNAECVTAPPTTQLTTQTTVTVQPEAGVSDDCRSSGFEDGMNSGFNVNTWTNCGADQSMYYDGFVSGCTYYDAFTADYCENWANGSIK